MEYVELRARIVPENDNAEIITALLAEIGFESFVEENDFLLAYIPAKDFDVDAVDRINEGLPEVFRFSYSFSKIADQNWNAKWESDYKPVMIDNKVSIRAPFHPKPQNVDYDIIIEPKMSFGTAHHPTTAQIIKLMTAMDFTGRKVLDIGCGTAVLAILASMKGAKHIDAVDNDEWAYNNSVENIERNKIGNIAIFLDDAGFLDNPENGNYDIILANINRNILLNDIPAYAKALKTGGTIIMSGFYVSDLEILDKKASDNDLVYKSHISDNEWVAAVWNKK
jgi:ribosomal protein L11 methyltransferase